MSLVPPGTTPFSDINLYASVQIAVTSAALYDHALSLGREVELIWMKPPSLVTALYVIERYLGDVVLVAGLCLCFSISMSEEEYVNAFEILSSDLHNIPFRLDVRILDWSSLWFKLAVGVGIRLFKFRAWGALTYSWATQAIMQLRIYAMYRRSRRILVFLLSLFFCEIAAIAFIIWQEIGPHSTLSASNNFVPGEQFCAFSGINNNFVYIFIPFLCFEFFLFLLAARMFVDNMRRNREASDEGCFRINSFVGILARDSLCYFFVNLVACAVVMGLWQSVTELYANICVPFVMLLEVLVGTRLILDFRERYSRLDGDPVVSGRFSPLHFRGDDLQMDSVHISVRCQTEAAVVTDTGG